MATLSIVALAFLTWHKILGQVLLGEGYMYFNPALNFFSGKGTSIWSYDNFAKIIFDIFPPLFRDNVQAYLLLFLTIGIIFFITFYVVLYKITKNKLLAFTATVFFESNYLALFEYLGAGTYQRFAQRFPNLIPIIISFYFLWKFYENKKYINLLISFLLWAVAVFMGHFSSLALPILLIYPLIKTLTTKFSWKEIPKAIIVCLLFFTISFYLTHKSEQQPRGGFINFLQTEENLSERLLDQIPVITVPINLVVFIGKHWSPTISEPYLSITRFFLIPCLVMYLGGAWLVSKRTSEYISVYITLFLSMIATMFLYMYVDTRLDVTKYYGADRYFIFSTLFAVPMWAILIKAMFAKKEILYRLSTFLILTIFIFGNLNLIWNHYDRIQYKSEVLRRYTLHIKQLAPDFKDGTIVILPSNLQWPAAMIEEFISPNTEFQLAIDGWEEKYWDERDRVRVFNYKYNDVLSDQNDPEKWFFVDLTNDYRNGKEIIF